MIRKKQDGQNSFNTQYEWMRPEELIARRRQCPLIILPIGPLEYHGPHLPLGTDAINASRVAHAVCHRLGKGVVRPALTIGTEHKRPPELVESLGLEAGSYVVGMDFPSPSWNSHYLPEEVFAIVLAAELRILIGQGYRYIFIANGHGAENHRDVVDRLCIEMSNTTPARVMSRLIVAQEVIDNGWGGHAEIVETSLMMHYDPDCVNLGTLPSRDIPLHYPEFSICDGAAFTANYDPQHITHHDPRDATVQQGRQWFQKAIDEACDLVERMIADAPPRKVVSIDGDGSVQKPKVSKPSRSTRGE